MAAAMASMTLQVGAVVPGARRTSLFKSQKPSSSWICGATNDEGTPDVSQAGGDVATAVKEVATEAKEEVKSAATAVEESKPLAAAESAVDSTVDSISNLVGAASWYQEYGRSVAPGTDARDFYYGPNRPLWKGPFTQPKDVPDYLTGEFPGDYGCDIFKLVRLPKRFARLRSQELMNGRWAMLGIVGCLAPELINPNPLPGYEPVWFKAGAQIFSEEGIDYLGVPGFINAHSLFAIVVTQAALMGVAEWARVRFVPEGTDPFYPGGKKFDPLGFASDPEILAELKVKEIKNGRLAMLAMAGLFAQGAVTGVSPIQNFHDYFQI